MNSRRPEDTGSAALGLFGRSTRREQAKIVIIPVFWEVTTSYGSGSSEGPQCILKASAQLDLFDVELGNAYEQGYHLLEIPKVLQQLNDSLKPKALAVRDALEENGELPATMHKALAQINQGCAEMTEWVHTQAKAILKNGQIPAVLGGDHSVPEGNLRAISEVLERDFGILHIDAHADLRERYQGFNRSHASIMNNVMSAPWRPRKLVQVGIRDLSQTEYDFLTEHPDIHTFFDVDLKRALFEGETWANLCQVMVAELPSQVYISCDIDGLSPEYCPHTGTPVPGGLSFDQLNYLLRTVQVSGRRIVGFDLNEVAPSAHPEDEWDGNVGARVLYKLCGWTILSLADESSSTD